MKTNSKLAFNDQFKSIRNESMTII